MRFMRFSYYKTTNRTAPCDVEWCGAVQFMRFSYYKTANRTAPCDVERCGAVQCTITCSAVWLCHFAGGFGMIFTVCAVYAVW